MPTTYADLERMYDGPIPREELARCVEMAPRYTVHDQGEDAVLDRFSIFDGMRIVVMLNGDKQTVRRIADLLNQYGEG